MSGHAPPFLPLCQQLQSNQSKLIPDQHVPSLVETNVKVISHGLFNCETRGRRYFKSCFAIVQRIKDDSA